MRYVYQGEASLCSKKTNDLATKKITMKSRYQFIRAQLEKFHINKTPDAAQRFYASRAHAKTPSPHHNMADKKNETHIGRLLCLKFVVSIKLQHFAKSGRSR